MPIVDTIDKRVIIITTQGFDVAQPKFGLCPWGENLKEFY